jgi:hypothetical protein
VKRFLFNVATALAAAASLTALHCGEEEGEQPYAGVWEIVYRTPATSGEDALADFWFNSPADGWACADVNVLRYDGDRWSVFKDLSRDTPYKSGYVKTVCALTGDDVWVGGQFQTRAGGDATLLHFDGERWRALDVGGAWVSDIYFLAPNRGWVAAHDGIFFYDGSSWTEQADGDCYALGFLGDDFGWAGVEKYGSDVYLWDGSTWKAENLGWPPWSDLIHVDFVSPAEGWVTGRGYEYGTDRSYGIVIHKAGGGWNAAPWPDNEFPSACDFLSPTYGWVGTNGACYHWNGNRFTRYPFPEVSPLLMGVAPIWANAEDDVWVGSEAYFGNAAGCAYILHFSGFN